MTFFLQMLKNPQAQRAAQLEIEEVVGTNRLPTFDDMENLPYVRAVCTEALRYVVSLRRTPYSQSIDLGIDLPLSYR